MTFVDTGTLSALAVCGTSDSVVVRWTTHCIAADRAMAAWLAMKVRDEIVDTVLAVAGWSCGPIEHTFSQQPQRDETVMERPVVNAIDQYALMASRAPAPLSSSS